MLLCRVVRPVECRLLPFHYIATLSVCTVRTGQPNGLDNVRLRVEGCLRVDRLKIRIADEINPNKQLIKGGGAALTREKIIAGASRKFICIADDSKCVDVLGKFPLPVEVIPMARSFVAREMSA